MNYVLPHSKDLYGPDFPGETFCAIFHEKKKVKTMGTFVQSVLGSIKNKQ
jgi:hypothetical protein